MLTKDVNIPISKPSLSIPSAPTRTFSLLGLVNNSKCPVTICLQHTNNLLISISVIFASTNMHSPTYTNDSSH